MIQLSSVRRLVDVLDVEECDETGEVKNYFLDYEIENLEDKLPPKKMAQSILSSEFQAASSFVAIVCRLTEDLRERM